MTLIKNMASIFYALLFRRNKFYCQIELKETVFKIWIKPSKWLTDNDLQMIVDDIQAVTIAGQGEKEVPNYGVLTGQKTDLDNRIITMAYDKKTHKPIGFAAQIFLQVPVKTVIVDVLHLGLVFVDKAFQKKSVVGWLYILPNLLLLAQRGFRPIWVSNVSQVPCVIGVVAQHYGQVYPNPMADTPQTEMHKLIFEGIMQHHRSAFGTGEDATYDSKKQIIFDSYTGGSDNLKKTFAESAKYRDEVVNAFCATNLDYNRGDDFVQIGRLSRHLIHVFCKKNFKGFNLKWASYLCVAGVFEAVLTVVYPLNLKNWKDTEGASF
jgi:hypothetical protein